MSAAAPRRPGVARLLVRVALLFGVPLVAIAVGLHVYARGGRYIETENAYVKANVVAIAPEISGRVAWVGIADHERARAGAPLFRIDRAPFEIAVAQAEARMAVVHTEIESLRAEYREALVQADEARQNVRFLERQHARQKRLREQGLGSEERFDQSLHDLDVSRRRLQALDQRIRRVLASLGGDPDQPVELHPRYAEARAMRDESALDLARTEIGAPAAGVVTNMKLQPGEYVEAGDPVFSLVQDDAVWIEANLKETQLTHVREGQRATVGVDAYPDRGWTAEVATIAPATGAEFALLPPQNATGNWVKVVQRVPVLLRIRADESADAPALRAGMTVSVSIDTEHRRELPAFVKRFVGDGALPEPLLGLMRGALAWTEAPR